MRFDQGILGFRHSSIIDFSFGAGELYWTMLYLDHNSTTPVDPLVLEKMLPYFTLNYGNSASSFHALGWEARAAQEAAREQVARLLGGTAAEIFFTSGATESNNWVLRSLAERFQGAHFITSCVEHSSVLEPLKRIEKLFGIEVTYLPVNAYGQVAAADVEAAIRPSTRLISVMWVQNELGSINPIGEISAVARKHGILFHSDATQAVGKIPVSLDLVDLASFSSHKFYGPKGAGGLFVRAGVELPAQICGAGIGRAGTANLPGIVGLSEALKLSVENFASENPRLFELRSLLIEGLESNFKGLRFNTHPTQSLAGTLNVTFQESLPLFFKGLCASKGSACHSGDHKLTPTLAGIGLSSGATTLRISMGKSTTAADVAAAVQLLKEQISSHNEKLKALGPSENLC